MWYLVLNHTTGEYARVESLNANEAMRQAEKEHGVTLDEEHDVVAHVLYENDAGRPIGHHIDELEL